MENKIRHRQKPETMPPKNVLKYIPPAKPRISDDDGNPIFFTHNFFFNVVPNLFFVHGTVEQWNMVEHGGTSWNIFPRSQFYSSLIFKDL